MEQGAAAGDDAAFTASLPPNAARIKSFDAFVSYKETPSSELDANARLAPLMANLPPRGPHHRALPHLPAAALRAFELRAVEAPPASSTTQQAAAASSQSAVPLRPPPGDPRHKDVRYDIWADAYIIYDAMSNEWPSNWPRPPFAVDLADPSDDVWKPYALPLSDAPGWEERLTRWRDAPELAPQTVSAAGSLLKNLGKIVAMKNQKKAKRKADEIEQAARTTYEVEVKRLNVEFQKESKKLNKGFAEAKAEWEEVLSRKRAAKAKVEAAELQRDTVMKEYPESVANLNMDYQNGINAAVAKLWNDCPSVARQFGLQPALQ